MIGLPIQTCLLLLTVWLPSVYLICYDQSPFWFLSRPSVENLLDDQGRILSNKVRVNWGNLHNFKCIDYFQVEYAQKDDPNNKILTPRIDRFRRFYDIDVDPCTEYAVKVQASEDYQGRRDDFKAVSGEVYHKVDYTPRFMSKPSIKELKIRAPGKRGRGRRTKREAFLDFQSDYSWMADEEVPEEEEEVPEPVNIRVSWRLSQIDYPTCLDYFVLDYYDITYNESTFSRTIRRPFKNVITIDINSESVPCDPEFRYILRVFGLTGDETTYSWTPPSCVLTTPAPTTTLEPYLRAEVAYYDLEAVMEENDQLKAKIEGLNEEYAKIGLEVQRLL